MSILNTGILGPLFDYTFVVGPDNPAPLIVLEYDEATGPGFYAIERIYRAPIKTGLAYVTIQAEGIGLRGNLLTGKVKPAVYVQLALTNLEPVQLVPPLPLPILMHRVETGPEGADSGGIFYITAELKVPGDFIALQPMVVACVRP